MSFFYNFNETDSSKQAFLKVSLKDISTDSTTIIWVSNFSPLKQNDWNLVKLRLERIRQPFQIWFTAKESLHSGTRYQALDNVRVQDCQPPKIRPGEQCLPQNFKCTNGYCLDKTFTCDFDDNCGDDSDEKVPDLCSLNRMTSFENGYGRWGEGVKRKWSLQSANVVASLIDAPTFDHTTRKF